MCRTSKHCCEPDFFRARRARAPGLPAENDGAMPLDSFHETGFSHSMRALESTRTAFWAVSALLTIAVSCTPSDRPPEPIPKPSSVARPSTPAAMTNTIAVTAAPAAITPGEARQHMGERVTVRGKVADVHVTQKGDVFLNFGGKYPQAVFTAVCFGGAIPATQLTPLNGKTISVTGRIREYSGQVEIVLKSEDQIAKETGK
jgi:hypothetical protein